MANSPGSSSFTRAYDALGTRLALDPRARRSSAAAQRGRRPLRAARRHANTSSATAAKNPTIEPVTAHATCADDESWFRCACEGSTSDVGALVGAEEGGTSGVGAFVGAGTGARVVGASVAGVGEAVGASVGEAVGAGSAKSPVSCSRRRSPASDANGSTR